MKQGSTTQKKSGEKGKILSMEFYEKKARNHRLKNTVVYLVLFFVLVTSLAAYGIWRDKKVYGSFEFNGFTSPFNTSNAEVIAFGDLFLAYNSDGIHCINADGKELWTGTLEMRSPMIACGDARVVAADREGRQIYIYEKDGSFYRIDTASPVLQTGISSKGLVYAALDEGDVTAIYCYDPLLDNADKTVSMIYSTMKGSGYPLTFAGSPSGKLFAVSYLSDEGGSLSSHLAFYNFGEVGQNMPNNLMLTYTYAGEAVPYLYFFDENSLLAVTGKRMIFYGDAAGEDPKSVKEIFLQEEVRSVYAGNGRAAIIFDDPGEYRYRADIYGKNGETESTVYFDLDYDDIKLSKYGMSVYNGERCLVYRYNGMKKAEFELPEGTELLVPGKSEDKFTLIYGTSVGGIKLH
jgi:hypothetical protein